MDAETKRAKDLEGMMSTEGWKVFVDMAIDLRQAWVNDLIQEKDENEKTRLQNKIQLFDEMFEPPSTLVELLRESRKRS